MPVETPFARQPDLTLRQMIDSVRVFKEFIRTGRNLRALGGSMFWKSVGEYDYLVQRSDGRLTYLGKRTSATERQFDAFRKEREELRSRSKSLADAVAVAQRLNKAVRIDGVSTSLIKVLRWLEGAGLARCSLLLGPPVIQCYAQAAGLRAKSEPLPIPLLIDLPFLEARTFVSRVESALTRWTSLEQACFDPAVGMLIALRPIDKASKLTRPCLASCPEIGAMPPSLVRQLRVLADAPAFVHALIGQTGKMAWVRTVDPAAFALISRVQQSALAPIVDEMLRERMVVSQWPAEQREKAHLELHGIDEVPGLAIA